MSKGSRRRKMQCPREQFERNWDLAFGKPDKWKIKTFQSQSGPVQGANVSLSERAEMMGMGPPNNTQAEKENP